MVDTNAGDQGQVGIGQVHGVEPSTQADFQHHGIQGSALEQPEGRQGAHLEIGQGDIATRRFDCGEGLTEGLIAGEAVVELDALVVAQQVR